MTPVSEVLKTTFESARSRLVGLEKTVHKLEKKAQASLHEIQVKFDGAPKRIEGAWTDLAARIRPALVFVTREEFKELAEKVDELSAKVDKLAQARRARTVA
jgi:polyhydroxyalkanoate synthesis regulator phasin